MFQKYKIHIIYSAIIISLLIVAFFARSCESGKNDSVKEASKYFQDTVKHEKVSGIELATVHQAVVESQKQVAFLINQNDTLKKLISKFKMIGSVTKIQEKVTIRDSIKHDTIPCDFAPIHTNKSTPEYRIGITTTKSETVIDSLIVPNSQYILEGRRKTGLFKTEQEIFVINSNPAISTNGIQSLVLKEKKRIWERPGPYLLIGAFTGFVLGTQVK